MSSKSALFTVCDRLEENSQRNATEGQGLQETTTFADKAVTGVYSHIAPKIRAAQGESPYLQRRSGGRQLSFQMSGRNRVTSEKNLRGRGLYVTWYSACGLYIPQCVRKKHLVV